MIKEKINFNYNFFLCYFRQKDLYQGLKADAEEVRRKMSSQSILGVRASIASKGSQDSRKVSMPFPNARKTENEDNSIQVKTILCIFTFLWIKI